MDKSKNSSSQLGNILECFCFSLYVNYLYGGFKTNLRDVVMFPMNQQEEDNILGAPSTVTPEQLKELRIELIEPLPVERA